MRARAPPGIFLAVNDGNAGVSDIETAILVDCIRIRRAGDVERVPAYQGIIFER